MLEGSFIPLQTWISLESILSVIWIECSRTQKERICLPTYFLFVHPDCFLLEYFSISFLREMHFERFAHSMRFFLTRKLVFRASSPCLLWKILKSIEEGKKQSSYFHSFFYFYSRSVYRSCSVEETKEKTDLLLVSKQKDRNRWGEKEMIRFIFLKKFTSSVSSSLSFWSSSSNFRFPSFFMRSLFPFFNKLIC